MKRDRIVKTTGQIGVTLNNKNNILYTTSATDSLRVLRLEWDQ